MCYKVKKLRYLRGNAWSMHCLYISVQLHSKYQNERSFSRVFNLCAWNYSGL